MEQQERIASKAHELFMRYGIRSVSMDEIANHLGMSKKTIYQFYADKDALVEDVINIVINENRVECASHRARSENAVHEIFMAMDMVMEMLGSINPAVMLDLEKFHPNAFRKYSDHKNKFLYQMIRENIDWGKEEDLYRQEIQADIISRFRLSSMFMMFNPELFPWGKHSLPTLITEVTDNFLYGLVTPKGQKLIQKYKLQRQKTITV